MEVWLLEAQDVPKMDFFGSGQPYGKYVSATEPTPLPFPLILAQAKGKLKINHELLLNHA